MITEDYVSYEVAKLLEEKKFNEPCETAYYTSNVGCENVASIGDFTKVRPYRNGLIAAPTHQMALKWLREIHKICIEIGFTNFHPKRYKCKIYFIDDKFFTVEYSKDGFLSYEEAVEDAIKLCLKKII